MSSDLIYTTYIKTSAEKLWTAITNPEFTSQYWGHKNISDWYMGSRWQLVSKDGEVRIVGQVLESIKNKRLVLTWASPAYRSDEFRVIFEIESLEDMVRLNVIHDNIKLGSIIASNAANDWPLILSSMKSFIETGNALNLRAALR